MRREIDRFLVIRHKAREHQIPQVVQPIKSGDNITTFILIKCFCKRWIVSFHERCLEHALELEIGGAQSALRNPARVHQHHKKGMKYWQRFRLKFVGMLDFICQRGIPRWHLKFPLESARTFVLWTTFIQICGPLTSVSILREKYPANPIQNP